MKGSVLFLGSMVIFLCAMGCKSDYTKYVERELAKEGREDSLLLGMYIGEKNTDFFEKCLQLNLAGKVTNGSGNRAVYKEEMDTTKDMTFQKELRFYGTFDVKNTMIGMEMEYLYANWAPWNKQLYADSLVLKLIPELEQRYGGNKFMEFDIQGDSIKSYVKIDKNRQILMYKLNVREVKVKITDLTAKKDKIK